VLGDAARGAWNVHASLLPRYRGAAPVERAIMNGDSQTGVSIMKMDPGLDTGPVALQRATPIGLDTTGGELLGTLAQLGAEAVVEVMHLLEKDTLTLHEQANEKATYAAKLEEAERRVPWSRSATQAHNTIRALTPHIGARAFHPGFDGPLRVVRSRVASSDEVAGRPGRILPAKGRILVACGSGVLEIVELQAPGRRALSALDFLRGNRLEGAFGLP